MLLPLLLLVLVTTTTTTTTTTRSSSHEPTIETDERIRAAGVWGNNGRVGARGGDGNGQGSERESMGFIRGRSRRARCASYLLGGGKQKCACAQPRLVSVQLWTQSSHVQEGGATCKHTRSGSLCRSTKCMCHTISVYICNKCALRCGPGVACTRACSPCTSTSLSSTSIECSSRCVNNTP